MTLGFDRAEYVRLLDAFPPVKIRSADQAEATEANIEELLTGPRLSPAERAFVDLLSDLLAAWEEANVSIPDVHGADLVKFLLKERGLRQRDLVGVFAAESIVSEVLAGRRDLTRSHIEQLAAFFHVSPAAFFPVRSLPTRPTSSRLKEFAGSIPPLPQSLADKEMAEIAAEEHARHAAGEGRT